MYAKMEQSLEQENNLLKVNFIAPFRQTLALAGFSRVSVHVAIFGSLATEN